MRMMADVRMLNQLRTQLLGREYGFSTTDEFAAGPEQSDVLYDVALIV
jgi:hypothetical protein